MTPRPRKVYISGPMTGYPDDNFPAFRAAAVALRRKGFEVVSPAEMDSHDELEAVHAEERYGPMYQALLRRDLDVIKDPEVGIEAIVLLPGWTRSNGALRELGQALSLDKRPILLEDALA